MILVIVIVVTTLASNHACTTRGDSTGIELGGVTVLIPCEKEAGDTTTIIDAKPMFYEGKGEIWEF